MTILKREKSRYTISWCRQKNLRRTDQKGNAYIDATCPFVARIHKIVREKTEEGYFILIAGDKDHPEVQGIVGHCDENYYVFKDEDQLKVFLVKIIKI